MEINIKGYTVLIDEDDVDIVNKYRWSLFKSKRGQIYFQHGIGNGKNMLLHRLVMGCKIGDGIIIDHINGNTLDNRKSNLRRCTVSQNASNAEVKVGRFAKGVTYHKSTNKYMAQITVRNNHIYLGIYDNPVDAHKAYCAAAIKYHGDYAMLERTRS